MHDVCPMLDYYTNPLLPVQHMWSLRCMVLETSDSLGVPGEQPHAEGLAKMQSICSIKTRFPLRNLSLDRALDVRASLADDASSISTCP